VPSSVPRPVFVGDKKVGELRSVAAKGEGFVGLAMLSLLGLQGGAAAGGRNVMVFDEGGVQRPLQVEE
jgi:hypothetical protein